MTTQKQIAGSQSLSIQSARDTIIAGTSSEDVKSIVEAVLEAQMPLFAALARETVQQRNVELKRKLLTRFAETDQGNVQAFRDPDFQYVLAKAQNAFARVGDDAVADLLVDMIAERSKHEQQGRLRMSLNSAIEIVAELTENEFSELSLCFLLRYTQTFRVGSIETFAEYFQNHLRPFLNSSSRELCSYQYLESKQCAHIEVVSRNLYDMLRATYGGIFNNGFTMEDLRSHLPPDKKDHFANSPLLIPCLNDSAKFQFKAINGQSLEDELKSNLPITLATNMRGLFENRMWTNDEFVPRLSSCIPDFADLEDLWKSTPLKHMKLTSLGIAVAFCNIKRVVPDWNATLETWIR